MKRIIHLLAALALFGCSKEIVQDAGAPAGGYVENAPGIDCTIPGQVSIFLSDELMNDVEENISKGCLQTGSVALDAALKDMGATSIERVFPYAGEFEERTRAEGMHKWYRVRYDESVPETKAFSGLSGVPGIEIVEAEPARKQAAYPFSEDSRFTTPSSMYYQWHYICTNDRNRKAGADINVENVWKDITTGNPDVIVAVVDGGIQLDHPDLAWNCSTKDNYCFVYGYDGTTIHPHEHGTHVAGTIAAVNNNGKGGSGVAGGRYPDQRGVTLLSCEIFKTKDSKSDYGGDSAAAIKWAADHGAVLCNNSWGYVFSTESQAKSGTIMSTDKAAVDYFNKYAGMDKNGNQVGPMAGGVVFFAAGNEGWSAGWPAKYDGVVSVGAFTSKGKKADYSNYGPWVDIAAPGGNDDNGNYGFIWSTVDNSEYAGMAGTSMACPHVCGVAALLVSKLGKPGFTRGDLIKILLDGADPDFLPSDAQIGPKVDAYGSFQQILFSTPLPPSFGTVSVKKWAADIQVKVAAMENGDCTDKTICLVGKDRDKLLAADPLEKTDGIIRMEASNMGKGIGSIQTFNTGILSFKTKYYAVAYSADGFGHVSSPSEVVTFDVPDNLPPTVTETIPDMGIGLFSRCVVTTLDLKGYFSDPEGEKLSYSADCDDQAVALAVIDGSSIKISPTANNGTARITVTASDGFNSVSQTFGVVCRDPSTLFDAFPNPVSDALTLRSSSPMEADVRIVSSTGAEVFSSHMRILPLGTQAIDCSKMAPGIYRLSITGDGKDESKDIVKL